VNSNCFKALETGKKKLRSTFELDSIYSIAETIKKESAFGDKIRANAKDIYELFYYLNDSMITLNNFIQVKGNIVELLAEQNFES
jgi:hypothetical protein